MSIRVLNTFLGYYWAFEESYLTDDWGPVEACFEPDAVYRVEGSPFDCSLHGPAAIVGGLRRSVDGFDRKLDGRRLDLMRQIEDGEDRAQFELRSRYELRDAPPLVFRVRIGVRIAGDRIAALHDTYAPADLADAMQWLQRHGEGLDASYA